MKIEDRIAIVVMAGLVMLGMAIAVIITMTDRALGAELPAAAKPYERTVIREAHAGMGLNAPTAMFGAQIQTESGWRPNAHSIYASGLAQFIPGTAREMAQRYPLSLGQGGPLNPEWAIRALVFYDRDIYRGRYVNAVKLATPCDGWAFALSGYNGGEGWISRDRSMCVARDPQCIPGQWWNHVEAYSARSQANFRQNRAYPRLILLVRQATYRNWGGMVNCDAR